MEEPSLWLLRATSRPRGRPRGHPAGSDRGGGGTLHVDMWWCLDIEEGGQYHGGWFGILQCQRPPTGH